MKLKYLKPAEEEKMIIMRRRGKIRHGYENVGTEGEVLDSLSTCKQESLSIMCRSTCSTLKGTLHQNIICLHCLHLFTYNELILHLKGKSYHKFKNAIRKQNVYHNLVFSFTIYASEVHFFQYKYYFKELFTNNFDVTMRLEY